MSGFLIVDCEGNFLMKSTSSTTLREVDQHAAVVQQ